MGKTITFFLFEGIGKNFPFNSILDFAILSDFKMRTVTICEKGVGAGAPRLISSQLKVPPHTHTIF